MLIDSGHLADADNSAKAILAASLLGLPSSARGLVGEFEAPHYFRTHKNEQDESLSANCNVLEALLHCPGLAEYVSQIIKVAQFLCKTFYSGNNIRDKWVWPWVSHELTGQAH
jgi:hypothetical protein